MNKWAHKWAQVYLKCYINLILYYRNVYPQGSFDLTTFQGFNLPQFIPITRHPGLQNYIEEWIQDVLGKLTHIYKLSILILDQQYDIVLERYVLDFSEFKHLEASDDDDNDVNIGETEVFDEFRSSLNSLINKMGILLPIKDNTVTFNFMINTVNMELGHGKDVGWNLSNKEQLQKFESDTNWTRVHDEDEEKFVNIKEKPVIKMVSLIGCDIGSLIIHNYMELLELNKIDQIPLKLNDIYDLQSSSLNSTPF